LVDKFPDSTVDKRYLFYRDGQTKEITSVSTFTQGYALPKFKNKTKAGLNGSNNATSAHVDIDFPLFRLADVYLMYAEASLRNGNSSEALQYVNRVRERGYGNTNFNFSSVTLQDILDERARELKWEGVRRTDLIRYGQFTGGSYVWPFKGGDPAGTATASFLNIFPLPTSDLVLNNNLIQNTGY
jgi:hypothetical protein